SLSLALALALALALSLALALAVSAAVLARALRSGGGRRSRSAASPTPAAPGFPRDPRRRGTGCRRDAPRAARPPPRSPDNEPRPESTASVQPFPSFLLRYPPMSEKLPQGQEKYGADERHWRDVGAGLSVLDLHEENGRRMQLARITPGGRILAHKHEGTEV